jgi:hypothetical protein
MEIWEIQTAELRAGSRMMNTACVISSASAGWRTCRNATE